MGDDAHFGETLDWVGWIVAFEQADEPGGERAKTNRPIGAEHARSAVGPEKHSDLGEACDRVAVSGDRHGGDITDGLWSARASGRAAAGLVTDEAGRCASDRCLQAGT